MDSGADNILEVDHLKVWFPVRKGIFSRITGYVKAVDDVSFVLRRGETLGIVGESGSGKSTIVRAIAGLNRPTGGVIRRDGRLGMVFQDPLGSLNPRQTVREAIETVPYGAPKPDAAALLREVGMDESALNRYPHEFSGGQRQRVCIARAIALRPEILICDEAVSALDLSVRAQVLDLLEALKRKFSLSLLFITHDIGVVQHIADRVMVMNHGRCVESGTCEAVLKNPQNDYTRYLIASVPRIGKPMDALDPKSS